MSRQEIFEEWFIKQMGENQRKRLDGWHFEDGYNDSVVNAMWIGFNAGIELYLMVD